MRKLILLVTTLALVAVGAASFAAFESHLIDVRAHNEKATYVSPDDIDFGIVFMEQSYHKSCDPATGEGDCMKIHLSASFLDLKQTDWQAVDYTIYCEDKPVGDPDRGQANITPFILLSDSDPKDNNDVVDVPAGQGCGTVAYGSYAPPVKPPKWAEGILDRSFDTVDLWDMAFFAPLCSNNYNSETDPIDLSGRPNGGLIDSSFCRKTADMVNSDEYVDLASLVKFQVTLLED